jgi:preprotein translocase subunit SecG
MTVAIKLILTVLIIALMAGVLLVDGGRNNAGPGWFWRGGGSDVVRNILFNSDGFLRRFTKPILLLWLLVFLGVLWLVAPTA